MFAFLTEVRVLRRLTDNTDRGVTGASVLKPVGVQSVSEIASATTRRESLVILLRTLGFFKVGPKISLNAQLLT